MIKFISRILFMVMLTTSQFGYGMFKREQHKSVPVQGSEKKLVNEGNGDLERKVGVLEVQMGQMIDMVTYNTDIVRGMMASFNKVVEKDEEFGIESKNERLVNNSSSISEKLDFFANIVFCSVPVIFILSIIYNKYFAQKKKHKKSEDFDFDE